MATEGVIGRLRVTELWERRDGHTACLWQKIDLSLSTRTNKDNGEAISSGFFWILNSLSVSLLLIGRYARLSIIHYLKACKPISFNLFHLRGIIKCIGTIKHSGCPIDKIIGCETLIELVYVWTMKIWRIVQCRSKVPKEKQRMEEVINKEEKKKQKTKF